MPIDSARQFLAKLQADPNFRFNLVEVTRAHGHIGRSKFIKDAGLDFDANDLAGAKQDYVGKIPQHLSAIVDFISCGMIIVDPPTTRVA